MSQKVNSNIQKDFSTEESFVNVHHICKNGVFIQSNNVRKSPSKRCSFCKKYRKREQKNDEILSNNGL